VVDSNEIIFGLGVEPNGLTSNEAGRLVADVSSIADVVGLTVAEFIPRQVIRKRLTNYTADDVSSIDELFRLGQAADVAKKREHPFRRALVYVGELTRQCVTSVLSGSALSRLPC
jgi:hypothetical protein